MSHGLGETSPTPMTLAGVDGARILSRGLFCRETRFWRQKWKLLVGKGLWRRRANCRRHLGDRSGLRAAGGGSLGGCGKSLRSRWPAVKRCRLGVVNRIGVGDASHRIGCRQCSLGRSHRAGLAAAGAPWVGRQLLPIDGEGSLRRRRMWTCDHYIESRGHFLDGGSQRILKGFKHSAPG